MDAKTATTFGLAVDAAVASKIEIEVGDAKQAEFYPQFKTLHWDNECNFSARLVDTDPTAGKVLSADGVVEWNRDGRTARFYQKQTEDENGGFEFEVELAAPPASNVLEFSIQTKGFDFFYQGPLSELEIKLGSSRPENVVGSYAVYHSTKRDNTVGGKEYRSGKAFHIYRPWAEDAKGNRVWCDLKIDAGAGLMLIAVPQDFLAAAVYPVLVDPTFGFTSVGASENGGGAGYQIAARFVATGTGTVTAVSWYGTVTAPANARSGIYADSSGAPAALLASSGNVAVGSSFSWVDFTVSQAVIDTTPYWLAIGHENAYGQKYDAGSTNQFVYGLDAGSPALADPFSVAAYLDWKMSIYATYTASGGGGGGSTSEFLKMF